MERSQQQSWIQVIGRIAVHRQGHESHELSGATRSLLSILVAAGPEGAAVEDIATCFWTKNLPHSWPVSLRLSASHLSAQLPDGWDVSDEDGRFALVPGDGFVDAWRIDELHRTGATCLDMDWLSDGEVFADIRGVKIIEEAVYRLSPMVSDARARLAEAHADGERSAQTTDQRLIERVRGSRRTVLLASSPTHATVAQELLTDATVDHHVVVGDDRLLLPLGPFAMAFPELRSKIKLEQGVIETGSAARAFRLVSNVMALQAASHPQCLILAEAHLLDAKSLKLASLLVDQGRLADFSMLICGDPNYKDIRWLDFVRRSVTAGCKLIEPD